MEKFLSPFKKKENEESLKRIRIRLETRFSRYKAIECEAYIGSKNSPYFRVKKLETRK